MPKISITSKMRKFNFARFWSALLSPALGVAGIAVSIYALIVTSYDFQELKSNNESLRSLSEQIKTETENLNQVVSSVSTRYVGEFPENMEDLEQLLERSNKSLYIIADVIGYGAFSRNDFYQRYHEILRDKLNKGDFAIEILIYNDSIRIEAMKEQFGKVDWGSDSLQKKLPDFKKFLWERSWTLKKPDSSDIWNILSKENLIQLSSYLNKDLIQELENIKPEKQIIELDKRQDVFIWLADDNRGIFSYLNYGFNDHEVSFYTRDVNFIEVLKDRVVGLKKVLNSTNTE